MPRRVADRTHVWITPRGTIGVRITPVMNSYEYFTADEVLQLTQRLLAALVKVRRA